MDRSRNSNIVRLCFALSLLGRRALGAAAQHQHVVCVEIKINIVCFIYFSAWNRFSTGSTPCSKAIFVLRRPRTSGFSSTSICFTKSSHGPCECHCNSIRCVIGKRYCTCWSVQRALGSFHIAGRIRRLGGFVRRHTRSRRRGRHLSRRRSRLARGCSLQQTVATLSEVRTRNGEIIEIILSSPRHVVNEGTGEYKIIMLNKRFLSFRVVKVRLFLTSDLYVIFPPSQR